jgi:hypothetical protein
LFVKKRLNNIILKGGVKMPELTQEEKQRIYEEEKTRLEAQERLKAEKKKKDEKNVYIGCSVVIIICVIIGVIIYIGGSSGTKSVKQEDKSQEIASYNNSAPPTGFRNFNWGSSPSASLKLYSGPTDDGTTVYVPTSGKSQGPLFDLPVAEDVYSFSNGKFFSGSAFIDGQGNFEKVKTALYKLYGKPTFRPPDIPAF